MQWEALLFDCKIMKSDCEKAGLYREYNILLYDSELSSGNFIDSYCANRKNTTLPFLNFTSSYKEFFKIENIQLSFQLFCRLLSLICIFMVPNISIVNVNRLLSNFTVVCDYCELNSKCSLENIFKTRLLWAGWYFTL